MGRKRLGLSVLIFILIINLWPGSAAHVSAQSLVEFQNVAAFVEFGQSVTIQALVVAPISPVQTVFLSIQPQGLEPLLLPVTINENGELVFLLNTQQNPLRAFSRVTYSFRVTLKNGESITSNDYVFDYSDTRYFWQALENEKFQVYWYDRDVSFGQQVLNIAQAGLEAATNLLPVQLKPVVRVYIYNNSNDMKGALSGSQPWIAGQTTPDLGVILLAIPTGPEETLELERQIPHELMHILLYQFVGEQYANLPVWLVEGLASVAEIYPNAEYTLVLNQSAVKNNIQPIESFCTSFPRDASGAFLAYAESASFVSFIHRAYGASALRWLVERYQNGLGCAEGVENALGSPLSQLEYRWKQEELRMDPETLIFRNLLPYLLLLGLLFGAAAVAVMVTLRPHTTRPVDDQAD
jgi:hypothetical protein